MFRLIIITISLICSLNLSAKTPNDWQKQFSNPPSSAYPWTFWYWMYGCVTDEAIRLDLKAMHDAQINGFYLMPIKDVNDSKDGLKGESRQLSTEWWKRMNTVFHTADSLGLQMGIHFSDGFALGGGPWIKPEESMQKIVWSDTIISGGKVNVMLQQPTSYKDYYKDIAVYAYPANYSDDRKPKSSVTFPFRSSTDCEIVMSYDSPFTLRQVQIVTGGNNYQAHRFSIYASDNGKDYHFVHQLTPARQGWQNTDAHATYSVPTTKAKFFKFCWTPRGSEPGSEDMDAAKWKPNLKVADILLGSEPVVDGYEGKSGLVWRISKAQQIADDECLTKDKFLKLDIKDGNLATTLPKGKWHILRIGHTSTGHTNATGGGGKGLECDKFSRSAIDKQFDNWFGEIYRHAPQDVVRRVLTRLHVDSWECGSQNWSSNFADEFRKRRGYDIMPWLPLYAGVPMETSVESDRVMRDIRQTIADLINDIFYDEVAMLGKRYGCTFSAESVAPTMVSDGMTHYRRADYPMGEFWLNSPTHDKPNDMLDAISGAHVYGKNIVLAEGFTEVRGVWDEHPAMLKTLLDRNYCLGMNGIVFHVNTHNPWTDRKPGMTLDGIGTFFQRDQTWWPEMKSFSTYISRCQALLQYGKPVADLAVYTGDETPRRSVLPERLVNTLPGLFGEKAVAREKKRIANIGQPIEESPVGVNHQANIINTKDYINLLRGYRYDSFNHDALSTATFENGNLITRGGMKYSALVVPVDNPMNPNNVNTAIEKINTLKTAGLKVISTPWNAADLSSLGIRRDIEIPEGLDYTHRHGVDADIYFISNQTENEITFSPKCRAEREHKYIADPMSGKVYNATSDITLNAHASIFYILSDKVCDNATTTDNTTGATSTLDKLQWTVTFANTNKTIKTDRLFDWSTMADNDVKYYSGHATYETTFKMKKKKNQRVILDLGTVHNIASVSVNGKDCGTVWMSPFSFDITEAMVKGNNTLTIKVVNTWANALLGTDNGTPPFSRIWTNGKYRRAEKTLLPAGMIGPIRVEVK